MGILPPMGLATTRAGALRPQYSFRQPIALRVAAGMDTSTIAGIERAGLATIQQLLGERSFQRLILHYEDLTTLDPAGRRARILAMVVEVIQLSILASNIAVADLVLHEEPMGRWDPAETVPRRSRRPCARRIWRVGRTSSWPRPAGGCSAGATGSGPG